MWRFLSTVLHPMSIRPVFTAALFGMLCLYLVAAGRLSAGVEGTIQIEYGMYQRDFEGLNVEIDGKVAGQLRGFASPTRAGFAVKEGQHVVRLLAPTMPTRAEKVQVYAGSSVLLLLVVRGGGGEEGAPGAVLTFEQ